MTLPNNILSCLCGDGGDQDDGLSSQQNCTYTTPLLAVEKSQPAIQSPPPPPFNDVPPIDEKKSKRHPDEKNIGLVVAQVIDLFLRAEPRAARKGSPEVGSVTTGRGHHHPVDVIWTADEDQALLLAEEIDHIVRTTGWSEYLAERILHGLEDLLYKTSSSRDQWGEALTEAYDRAVEAANTVFTQLVEYAKTHPGEIAAAVLLSLFACGVLVRLAPRILVLLGFSAEGPVEGSFAAWFQSTYGGYVPKGSLMSYLQRLGMTWG